MKKERDSTPQRNKRKRERKHIATYFSIKNYSFTSNHDKSANTGIAPQLWKHTKLIRQPLTTHLNNISKNPTGLTVAETATPRTDARSQSSKAQRRLTVSIATRPSSVMLWFTPTLPGCRRSLTFHSTEAFHQIPLWCEMFVARETRRSRPLL